MEKTLKTRLVLRQDTTINWNNETLKTGELGVELDAAGNVIGLYIGQGENKSFFEAIKVALDKDLADIAYSGDVDDISGITGAVTSILSDNLAISKVIVSDAYGKVAASGIDTEELNYISGTTSNIQTQINSLSSSITTTLQDYYLKTQTLSTSEINAAISAAIANLVDSAPETLDTLEELAQALGDDPNFATTITELIATKANDNAVVKLTGDQTIAGVKNFTDTPTINGEDVATINNLPYWIEE